MVEMVRKARWESLGLAMFACCAVSTVAAWGAEEAPATVRTATAPASTLPRQAASGRDVVAEELARGNLPTDIPLPERTPYDWDPKKREEYLQGYRVGFMDGVLPGMSYWLAPSHAWRDGKRAGNTAGWELWRKRADADIERRFGFSGRKAIGENSSAAERFVLESFREFRTRLLASVKKQFPRSLQMSDDGSGYWKVIPYSYDDYSTSNSGVPVHRQAIKAMCSFTLSVATGAVEEGEVAALKGEYFLDFGAKDGQWIWDRESMPEFHMQTEGPDQERTGLYTIYHGGGGPLVVDRIEQVIAATTRPAVDGR